LVVADYFRAGLWRNEACRGATFLFLQYCADMFGPSLLRELALHPATGVAKLEAVTGEPFEGHYRRWTIAVHRGRLESVDLRRPLGECRLHGPRRHWWSPAEGPLELVLRGTSDELRADRSGAGREEPLCDPESPTGSETAGNAGAADGKRRMSKSECRRKSE